MVTTPSREAESRRGNDFTPQFTDLETQNAGLDYLPAETAMANLAWQLDR